MSHSRSQETGTACPCRIHTWEWLSQSLDVTIELQKRGLKFIIYLLLKTLVFKENICHWEPLGESAPCCGLDLAIYWDLALVSCLSVVEVSVLILKGNTVTRDHPEVGELNLVVVRWMSWEHDDPEPGKHQEWLPFSAARTWCLGYCGKVDVPLMKY